MRGRERSEIQRDCVWERERNEIEGDVVRVRVGFEIEGENIRIGCRKRGEYRWCQISAPEHTSYNNILLTPSPTYNLHWMASDQTN